MMTFASRFSDSFGLLFLTPKKKEHNLTCWTLGEDYSFDLIDDAGLRGYMTGQKSGIKPGDILILRNSDQPTRYQVEAIEYYADPPDVWSAFLRKVT